MLPNPQDAPAEAAEGAGDEAVAGAVGGDLLPPEGGVGFGRRGVERAAGPAAVVDENGEAVRKAKSGLTRKAFNSSPSPFRRSEAPRRQPVKWRARKSARRRSSVAALPRERIADITAERFFRVKISAMRAGWN